MHQARSCVHHLLEDYAASQPDAIALRALGRPPLSYGQLWRKVSETAALLNRHGIGADDRVAIVLPNGPDMAAAFLSVSATAACAPLNPASRADEFDRVLRDLSPKAVIVRADAASPARTAATILGIPVIELSPIAGEPAGLFSLDIPALGTARPAAFANAASVALVLHTSGTTAHPKTVALTQANMWHSARQIANTLHLQPSDRCLNVMPLFHVHGLAGALLSSIAAGSSIVCAPDFVAPKFFEWMDEFEPTWYTAVPPMHAAIAARAAHHQSSIGRSRLRFVRSSSAPLPTGLMAELESIFSVPVIEAYGMTEAAHQIASNPLPPGTRKPGSVGIATGADVAVLDNVGNTLGTDREGDIVIRGPQVAGDGWLRTGDRGRIDADGYLFLTGRTKEIINRGGEKISPREVEDVLRSHPAVADAVCFAAPDPRLGEDVAAAVVLRGAPSVTALDLREFVSSRLADFKVPRLITFVDEIPTGPTGKPQRVGMASRLGISAAAGLAVIEPPFSPRTPTERVLCSVWSDVLGVDDVGVDDDFFALGGDSILATQILSRLRAATGAELSMVRFFDAPTVRQIAAQLPLPLEASTTVRRERSPRASTRRTAFPLSSAQQSMWLLSQLDPDSPASNVTMLLQCEGELELAALTASLNEIARRHETLRTTFTLTDEGPVQSVADSLQLGIDIIDLSAHPEDERSAELSRQTRTESDRPFDLASGPLIRARLYRLDPNRHVLHIAMHHIATDASSRRILANELVVHYDAFSGGRPSPLEPLPWQYADFAGWEKQALSADVRQGGLAFWKEALAGAPTSLALPVAPGLSDATAPGQGSESIVFATDFVNRLRDFSRSRRVSVFMTLAAAFDVLLSQLTGEHDIAVGVPTAGRPVPQVEDLIGCFTNTIVLRTNLTGDPTFAELLDRVRDTALAVYANQDLPFDAVVQALAAKGSERALLFNVMLDFVDQVQRPASAGAVTFSPIDTGDRMPDVDLMLDIKQHGEGFNVWLHYRPTLFAPPHAIDLLRRFERLLSEVMEAPDAHITSYSTAPILSAQERGRVLVEWNQTAREYPPLLIHQLLERRAAQSPHDVAVTFGEVHVTYDELNRRANGLAHHLRRLGAGPDVLVGVFMERSIDMVAALLGILKAGGAYVPLDPAYPPARISYMLGDAAPPIVLTQRRLLSRLPQHDAHTIVVDDREAPVDGSDENLDLPLSLDTLAYVIYTSGSTGQPKGAINAHRAVSNRLQWGQEIFQLGPADRVLQKTALSFDISVWELFGTLMSGARLVLAERDRHADNAYLARVIGEERITMIHFVASLLDAFLEETDAAGCESLRYVVAGGEAMWPELQTKFFARSRAQLVNLYGPTEAAVECVGWFCNRDEPQRQLVPIGRPIANARVYILDRHRNPVQVGVPGELHIGGTPVGRGYWRKPELTDETFVPDPFTREPGARMYKTGDLARYLPDGTIEFLGRIDFQLKVRGLRIEPVEIETALLRHPGVEKCLATVCLTARREALLTAYVVPCDGASVSPPDLRSFALGALPQAMVPAAYVILPALPLTPSGKVDRRALPAPEPIHASQGFVDARDPTERALVAIWQEVLDAESVGVTDDFFELGGHSLAAIRVFDRISRRLQARLPASTLFHAPTIEQLAPLIGSREAPSSGALVPIQPHGSRMPLFCVPGFGGSALGFRHLSASLGDDQPLFALEPLGTDGRQPAHLRIEDMAAHYTAEICRVRPAGPYGLVGWSLGGVVAVEIARQLTAQGREVGLLAFLDAPALGIPQDSSPIEWSRYRARRAFRTLKKHLRRLNERNWRNKVTYSIGTLKDWALGVRVDAAYRRQQQRGTPIRRHTTNVKIAQEVARRRYRPAVYAGSAVLFRTKQAVATTPGDGTFGWSRVLTEPVEVHDMPGDHLSMLRPPHVQALADRLKVCLGACPSKRGHTPSRPASPAKRQ